MAQPGTTGIASWFRRPRSRTPEIGVIGDHHAALARGDLLVGVEREDYASP